MRVLLVKPRPTAIQFGLAPFFQTEPLGLEYIAAALIEKGHSVRVVDLRFERQRIAAILNQSGPDVVGISCLHILDVPATLALAQEVKTLNRATWVIVGGHAASAYPEALHHSRFVDAICIGEGERNVPALCEAIQLRRPLENVPFLLLRSGNCQFHNTGEGQAWMELREVHPPNRSTVAAYQRHYCCLNYMPVWTLETGRGCPHRCKFCSVWQFYKRTYRSHSPGHVRADFETVGRNLFVIDDIFWAENAHSEELGYALLDSPERKNWMLVQSRVDLVCQHPGLLELWRPLARDFDIFFGFESPTKCGLDSLNKGTDVSETIDAIRIARKLGYGITGNFIIDPDFSEEDFSQLWDFLDTHQLYRVGFTILTPLPGTYFFEQSKSRLEVFDWNQYDLHHLLWRPRLPVERFFELYCATWRRTVLNAAGRKRWWRWFTSVNPVHLLRLARILARTQKLMDPQAYISETKITLTKQRERMSNCIAPP
jgi:radical SAM superfamily enzyme YgiQ (UPF0313 family)